MVYWFLPYNIYEISAFPLIHAYMNIIRQFQEKFNSRITDIIIFTQGIIMTNHEQLFEINGVVENIIYRNEENGYTVLEISGDEALITANGVMPLVNAGESVKLFGVFKNHPTYGEQFAVSAFERTMPENMDGILKYLSSGAIKGIEAQGYLAEKGAGYQRTAQKRGRHP